MFEQLLSITRDDLLVFLTRHGPALLGALLVLLLGNWLEAPARG